MEGLLFFLAPILAGFGLNWFAGKCRGRNAKNAFQYAAWGSWFLLLLFIPLPIPFYFILKYIPSVLCFWLAANSMLKEMRAQKEGEFTERA